MSRARLAPTACASNCPVCAYRLWGRPGGYPGSTRGRCRRTGPRSWPTGECSAAARAWRPNRRTRAARTAPAPAGHPPARCARPDHWRIARGEDRQEPAQATLDRQDVDDVRPAEPGLRPRVHDIVDLHGQHGIQRRDQLAGKRRSQLLSGARGRHRRLSRLSSPAEREQHTGHQPGQRDHGRCRDDSLMPGPHHRTGRSAEQLPIHSDHVVFPVTSAAPCSRSPCRHARLARTGLSGGRLRPLARLRRAYPRRPTTQGGGRGRPRSAGRHRDREVWPCAFAVISARSSRSCGISPDRVVAVRVG